MQHALHRTSPKGGPFIGTCANCGTPNLTIAQGREDCPNQRGMTQDATLLEAISLPGQNPDRVEASSAPNQPMLIHNGDHAQYEIDNKDTPPKERSDWPVPSFDAADWAEAFCKIATKLGYKDAEGGPIDEGWMIGWFANSLMRGFDEANARAQPKMERLKSAIEFAHSEGFQWPSDPMEEFR